MWKYPICRGTATYEMPRGAEIMSCGCVGGEVVVWALVTTPVDVNAEGAMVEKTITCAMAGEAVDAERLGRFIGTATKTDVLGLGTTAFHVFEDTRGYP